MMQHSTGVRAALLALAGTLGLLAGGCGGGSGSGSGGGSGNGANDPTDSSALQATEAREARTLAAARTKLVVDPPPAYTVVPDELVTNGQFGNGLAGWSVGDATLVASQVRPGGYALNVGWQALQTFAVDKLAPGKSYTLTVKARNEQPTGATQVAVLFRLPASSEAFRTYKVTVVSNAYQDYAVDFTVPAYAANVQLNITASGTRTIIDSVSLKMRSGLAQTEPIASMAGSYVPAGYALAFNDEFNGTALNRSKWFTRYIYASGTMDHLNDEKERYRDNNNHVVANGVLSLVARQVSSSAPDGANYESGMIRSDWTSRTGYYEARVKMPGGLGVWPAFWLNSDVSSAGRLAWPPEIDIFEFVNNGVEDTVNMLHSGVQTSGGATSPLLYADPAFNPTWTYYLAPFNFNDGWHTIGGSWAGRHGIDNSAFPQALQIDWVRAYRKLP